MKHTVNKTKKLHHLNCKENKNSTSLTKTGTGSLVEAIGNKTLELGWGWGSNDGKVAEEPPLSPSPRHLINGIQEEMGHGSSAEP